MTVNIKDYRFTLKGVALFLFDYFRALLYWCLAITILIIIALLPIYNLNESNAFHHLYVLERLRK